MKKVEIAVLGGGPAGLSSAIAAAEAGAEVLVIDENPQPGGQIYRQYPEKFQSIAPNALSIEQLDGKKLLERAQSLPIEFLNQAIVWGIFDGKHLCLMQGNDTIELWAERVILAPGVYERPVPFPGWTLPGVMTAGAVQNLIKGQWVIPGQRFLLAGTGPLQLALASQLLENGAEVAGIVDASSLSKYMRLFPRLCKEWKTMKQGLHYVLNVLKSRTTFLASQAVVRAEGDGAVEKAVTSQVDKNWRPISGTEREWDVDTVCVGYGFITSIELAMLAGCRVKYSDKCGYWKPERDRDMRTSVPGIYVVGDVGGLGGAVIAAHEGNIAGVNAAMDIGYLKGVTTHPASLSYKKLERLSGYKATMEEIYEFKPGIYDALQDDTLICRCEEVTYSQVKEAIKAGAENVNQIKSWTRSGMGLCQGRFCEFTIASLLEKSLGEPLAERRKLTVRPPIKPVPIEALIKQ